MKKTLLIFLVAALMATLFACAANNNDYGYTLVSEHPDHIDYAQATQPQDSLEPVEMNLSIYIASGELPPPAHIFYIDEHVEHGMTATRDVLRIQAEATLYNLAVVFLGNDVEDEHIVYIIEETFPITDALAPGQTLMIADFFSLGTLPWNGIAFEDANGLMHHYAIIQNQADYGPAYFLMEIVLAA